MEKKLSVKICKILAILSIVILMVFALAKGEDDTLLLLQSVDENISQYLEVLDYPLVYQVEANGENFYISQTSSSGYGGNIEILTKINLTGEIEGIAIIEDYETPMYLKKVIDAGFLSEIIGLNVTDEFSVDAAAMNVSGASVSAVAIMNAAEIGAIAVGNNFLGTDIEYIAPSFITTEFLAISAIILVACLASFFKLRKLRPVILLISVGVIGFYYNASISLTSYTGILLGQVPAFNERAVWYVLIFGILLITLIWGKNIYCGWICPFGAAQEGIHKALSLSKTTLNSDLTAKAKKSRYFALYIAVVAGLLAVNPGVADFQPFSAFFAGSANVFQWVMMILIVLISIGIYRFWCTYFCPVGLILDLTALLKGKTKRKIAHRGCKNTECKNSSCPSREKVPYTSSDIMFIIKFVVIYICIIGAIYLNLLG